MQKALPGKNRRGWHVVCIINRMSYKQADMGVMSARCNNVHVTQPLYQSLLI